MGFAASSEGSTELHSIENWSFRTYGFVPVRHPHNVSDDTVIVKPPIIQMFGHSVASRFFI